MSKVLVLVSTLLCFLSLLSSAAAQAKPLSLVTTEWESFTHQGAHSERHNEIVEHAFERAGHPIHITTERPAFAGSGLSSGKYQGRIDFIDLNPFDDDFVVSAQYLPLYLHLVSKNQDVENVRSFAQIRNARVAIENRFAATPPLRLVREIKWSRNPNTFESINNLAKERSNYLLTDSLFFAEFNRLLIAEDEELLHKSNEVIFTTGLHITLHNSVADAESILADFDRAITAMIADGSMNQHLGLAWILADTDNDNIAELVSSVSVQHSSALVNGPLEPVLSRAYQWDGSGVQAVQVVIDGQRFATWGDAQAFLRSNAKQITDAERTSYLDPNTYTRILRAW